MNAVLDWLFTQLHDAKKQLGAAERNFERSRNAGNKRLLEMAYNQVEIVRQLIKLVNKHGVDTEEVEL